MLPFLDLMGTYQRAISSQAACIVEPSPPCLKYRGPRTSRMVEKRPASDGSSDIYQHDLSWVAGESLKATA